jgi:hypothetical protein
MVWVRSEYAGELAVVAAWLSALLPWNITYSTLGGVGSVLFVRFPFVQVRYVFGISISEAVAVRTPLGALAYQEGQSIATAYQAWTVGAALVGAAVVLSLALYRHEETVESLTDPVAAMGVLLGLAGAVLSVATWLLWTGPFPGVPIPVGVVLLYLFGGTLLLARRE